jgi:hypothetical protein
MWQIAKVLSNRWQIIKSLKEITTPLLPTNLTVYYSASANTYRPQSREYPTQRKSRTRNNNNLFPKPLHISIDYIQKFNHKICTSVPPIGISPGCRPPAKQAVVVNSAPPSTASIHSTCTHDLVEPLNSHHRRSLCTHLWHSHAKRFAMVRQRGFFLLVGAQYVSDKRALLSVLFYSNPE